MNIYTVKSTDIVHNTSVDLITRWYTREVHIVQYDNSQPIVAVKLFKNSDRFVLPDGYEANLRFGKKDRTFIYKPVLGCNQDRDTVYFAVDEQMSMFYGKVNPIIEFTYNGAVVGSSSIPFVIDKNPIQIGDVESKSDYPAIVERISAKQDKLVSGTNIKTINGNSLLGTGDITINVEDLNPLKADITALKADNQTNKTTLAGLVSDSTTIKSNITTLRSDVASLKTDNTQNKTNISNKQDTLVSGTNIKSINGQSLLGSGDMTVGLPKPWESGTMSDSTPYLGVHRVEGNIYSGLFEADGRALYGFCMDNYIAYYNAEIYEDDPILFMAGKGEVTSVIKLPADFITRSQEITLGESGLAAPWSADANYLGVWSKSSPGLSENDFFAGLHTDNDLVAFEATNFASNNTAIIIPTLTSDLPLFQFMNMDGSVISMVKLPNDFFTRSQTINLGDINNSGGSGSRPPIYSHTITLKNSDNSAYFAFTIYDRTDEEVTKDTLFGYLNWQVCVGTGVASNALIDKIKFNRYADSTWVHQFLELSGQHIDKELKFDSVFGTDFTVEDIVRGPDWIPPR